MNSNGRKQIMDRLQQGVKNPELVADRTRELPAWQPRPFKSEALVARWQQELEALTGKVYGPMSAAGALEQLVALAESYEPKCMLAWADEDLPIPGVAGRLQAAGIEVIHPAGDTGDLALRERYAQIPLGLTGASAGLADTGSLIVTSGPGRPRSASLLPPVHIALLRVADLYPDLPTWTALQAEAILPTTANLVIITGPSKTADIELNLVLGVHGPGEVHVILLR